MHAIRTLTAVALTAGILGCSGGGGGGGGSITPEQTALTEVADLIRSVLGTTGRPPTKVGDFARLEPQYPTGYKAVKSGDVVVIWGAAVAGEGNAGSAKEHIVAYEKNAPTAGGYVLLANGTVKKLSASEFTSAPKAK